MTTTPSNVSAVTAKNFLAIAAAEIGYKEGYTPSNDNWNNDNKYGRWYGMNFAAWCGMFVSWCANECHVMNILVPKYASTFAGLTWFRQRGLTGHWPPAPGDIFFMSEYHPDKAGAWNDTTGTGWLTVHTGIVEKYLGDGKFQTIEGNTNTTGSSQGNGVYRLIRQDTEGGHKFIFGRPKWAPEPVVVVPPSGGGGTSAPLPTPKPPAPIPGATYTGSKYIDVSKLEYLARHGGRHEVARRWNGLVWAWLCKNSPAYCRANLKLWQAESAYVFGKQGQRATQEMYRVLNSRAPKLYQKVTLPCWPGPLGVKAVGGTPV